MTLDAGLPTLHSAVNITFEALLLGDRFSCGFTAARETYCWGTLDELGLEHDCPSEGCSGSDGVHPYALRAKSLDGVRQVGATCVLTRAGEVLCKGNNALGQLGQPTSSLLISDNYVPVPGLNDEVGSCTGCGPSCQLCGPNTTCVAGECQPLFIDQEDGPILQTASALEWMQCTMPSKNNSSAWNGTPSAMESGVGTCPANTDPGSYKFCQYQTNACNAGGAENGDSEAYNTGLLDFGFNPGDAFEACKKASVNLIGGHSDWRVPTADELLGLAPLDISIFDSPTIIEFGLGYDDPEPTMAYWSANSYSLTEGTTVTFSPPQTHQQVAYPGKQNNRLVRCVRDSTP